jgi:hypothetical protein
MWSSRWLIFSRLREMRIRLGIGPDVAKVFTKNGELCQDVLKLIRIHGGQVPDPRSAPACEFHYHEEGMCSIA